jgi:hypothetical protein
MMSIQSALRGQMDAYSLTAPALFALVPLLLEKLLKLMIPSPSCTTLSTMELGLVDLFPLNFYLFIKKILFFHFGSKNTKSFEIPTIELRKKNVK